MNTDSSIKTSLNKSSSSVKSTNRKIFIGGFKSASNIEELLIQKFQKYGNILSIELKNKGTKGSTGHCILEFESPYSIKQILMNPVHSMNSKILECRPVLEGQALQKALQEFDKMRLFASNIPKGTTESTFCSKIENCNVRVKNCYVVKNRHKRRKTCIGFVTLFSEEDVLRVLSSEISSC